MNTFFINGGYKGVRRESGINVEEARKYLRSKKELGKVLLVTDLISSGRSIRPFVEFMQSERIDFDIAAVMISDMIYNKEMQIKYRGEETDMDLIIKRLFYGGVNSYTNPLYSFQNGKFKGVRKMNILEQSLFPERILDKIGDVKRARKAINKLNNELIEFFS